MPFEAVLLGYGPMLPIAAGAIGVWVLPEDIAGTVLHLTLVWTATIVAFLSGVRRGLSFRAPEGPTMAQRATFFWLFLLALGAIALLPRPASTALLALGCLSVAVLDTRGAQVGDAPPYFARLRPYQMAIAVVSLLAILIHQLR